jgi:GNAT superfamily N-acetyltransferase
MAANLDFVTHRLAAADPSEEPARLRDAVKALVRSVGPGVTLTLALEDGAIALDLLKVEADARGRGLGRKAMKMLVSLADRHRMPVRLHAISLRRDEPGPDQDRLEAWYERLGFARTGRHSVMGLAEMRREPRPACSRIRPARRQRTGSCLSDAARHR